MLLFFASPLFNGLGGVASWQKAYDANKTAMDFLVAQGKGLYSPYSKIWDDELNKEIVMVRRFNYPQATYFQAPLNCQKMQTAALIKQSTTNASTGEVLSDISGGVKKSNTEWQYLKSYFLSTSLELSYHFTRVQLGAAILIPVARLMQGNNIKPANTHLFWRWGIK